MNISKIQPVQNFKGCTIIQIPKSEFNDPENTSECVGIVLNKLMKFSSSSADSSEDNKTKSKPFSKKNKPSCSVYLESPGYDAFCGVIEKLKYNIYPLNWFAQNTQTALTEPLDENFHSFCVLTGPDSEKMRKEFGFFRMQKSLHNVSQNIKKTGDEKLDAIRRMAKFSKYLDTTTGEMIDSKNTKIVRLEKIDSLDALAQNIDLTV